MCADLRHDSRLRLASLLALVLCICATGRMVAAQDEAITIESEDPQVELDARIQDVDAHPAHLQHSRSRLSDVAIPLQLDSIPQRPAPLIELGDPFLGRGAVSEGGDVGTGAVWNPSFQVFGTFRSALQAFDDGDAFHAEWANRLDLYGNLAFTPTERILVGIRPIDDEGRDFVGYYFQPEDDDGWQGDLDGKLTTLFFEGDFGEVFPGLDPDDSGILDFGFAIGRQALQIQDGLLIDDRVDGFGLTRNTLTPWGMSNLRLTFFYAWNELDRANRKTDNGADMFALFTEADWDDSTYNLDLVWLSAPKDSGDAFFFALSATQRFGHLNSTFRFLGSVPADGDTDFTHEGYLLFAELSWTPSGTHDVFYLNGYWGIQQYSSALRSPDSGGPLARTGILYTAQGLGRFRSALDSDPAESVGLALGRQFFFDENRQQLIVEIGGRLDTDGRDSSAAAVGARYQKSFGQHFIFQVDAHASISEQRDAAWGLRTELQIKF